MTTLQLVRRKTPSGRVETDAVVNSHEKRPTSFFGPDQGPWLLGSEDLLMLATALAKNGYRATRVQMSGPHGTLLGEVENGVYENVLLDIVNNGRTELLARFVRSDLVRVFVASIDMRASEFGRGQVSLRAQGVVITHNPWQAENLGATVRRALVSMP